MDIAKLSRVNLSLLATLQALLQERNARAAARKLNLSQSTISKNLSQLRLLFDDPLFHRSSNNLVPTPLVKQLEAGLEDALFQIEALLNPPDFDPRLYKGRIRLAMHDAGFAFIGAPLAAKCHTEAPNLELDLWYKDHKGIDALINGEIDLLIVSHDVGHQGHTPEHLLWAELYKDQLACLVRPGNPILSKKWNSDAYLAATHIGVRGSNLDRSILDQFLTREQRARIFTAMAPDFHVATRLVREGDAIFTCSNSWAELAAAEYNLVKVDLPFKGYEYAYHMLWHKYADNSGLHNWMRDQIIGICSDIGLSQTRNS